MTTTTEPALCVDLDGTLVHTDLLLESLVLLIKRNPLCLLLVPLWLLGGKARLKQEISRRVQLNAASLPYVQPFVEWLQEQKERGRSLWLCTASDQRLAQAVADHLGLFAGIISSDGQRNLSGIHKAEALVQRFGERGFDYCGNHAVDLAVWAHAKNAVVVNASSVLATQAAALTRVVATFGQSGAPWRAFVRALRVHQWAKNALIVAPVAAAHLLADGKALKATGLAFISFSLCASSVYLLNDLFDLEADRQHPRKRLRPFASGSLSLLSGLVATPVLLLIAVGLSLLLPPKFQLVLGLYYLSTLAYSYALKRIVMVDVLALAGLYTIRIVAGAAAAAIGLTFWLLLFSIFIFLSLAMVKRYAELHAMREQGKLSALGRGYQVEDLALLQALGGASGYISILVLALYVNSPDIVAMYRQPKFVWLLCPIMLYWISRIWMQTHRGGMHDDPLVFALRDPVSLLTGSAAAAVLWLAV